jgi:hypothetical protein
MLLKKKRIESLFHFDLTKESDKALAATDKFTVSEKGKVQMIAACFQLRSRPA